MAESGSVRSAVGDALSSCRQAFIGIGAVSFVINILLLTGPIFMLQIYDRVLASGSVPTLVALSLIAVLLYIFMWVLDTLRGRMLVRVGQRLDTRLTGHAFHSAVMLPVVAGRKIQRIEPVSDLDRIRQFLSGNGPVALFDMPWMPLYLALVFLFHPLLGLVALIGGAVIVGLAVVNERLSRAPSSELARHTAQRHEMLEASRSNADAVVAMGMLGNLQRRWLDENRGYLNTGLKSADLTGQTSSLIKAIRYLLQSAVLGVGAYLAIAQEITPGIMIAASIITARALAPVEQAVSNWRGFVGARQGARRLSKTLMKFPEYRVAVELPAPRTSLEVDDLSVAPSGSDDPVVSGVGFKLVAGEGLGIIGPSGSGKSSLAKALVGVWHPETGEIRLDGAELGQWERDRIGRSIGYLPQDIELFGGTVAQNIARFDPEATSEEIIGAARLAHAHDLITRMPDGYETLVGESGATLSGGQQQYIGLARALFRKPFLVVLDEPNSNMDAEGEKALTAAVQEIRKAGSIVVIIAHRPSAIAAVDKLLRLDAGRLVDFGIKRDVLGRLSNQVTRKASGLKVVSHAG